MMLNENAGNLSAAGEETKIVSDETHNLDAPIVSQNSSAGKAAWELHQLELLAPLIHGKIAPMQVRVFRVGMETERLPIEFKIQGVPFHSLSWHVFEFFCN